METARHRLTTQALLLGGLALISSFARADIMFLDGGYAELCSDAAFSLEHNGKIDVTGSRVSLSPLEICTRAIDNRDGTLIDLAASYNNRGVMFFIEGEYDMALQDFDNAIAQHNLLAQAHVNRGYTLMTRQQWAEAVKALTTGIDLGSREADKAYFNRGVAYEELGDIRKAYYDYSKAAELNPAWEEPQRELARFTVSRK